MPFLKLEPQQGTGVPAMIIFLLLTGSGRGWRAGLLSAAAYLTCLAVFVIGTSNLLDSVFAMFITATMVALFFAYQKDRPRKRVGLFLSAIRIAVAGSCPGQRADLSAALTTIPPIRT